MRFAAARFAVAALLTSALAACAAHGSSFAPITSAGNNAAPPAVREPIPNVGGVYNGTTPKPREGAVSRRR